MLAQDLSTNKGALISANRPVDEKMNESKKKNMHLLILHTTLHLPITILLLLLFLKKKKIVHVLLVI